MYFTKMEELGQKRKGVYSAPRGTVLGTKLETISSHLETARTFLPYAPNKHIRRILALSRASTTPFDKVQFTVYVVFSLLTKKLYVGKTGRTLAHRFYEHIGGGQRIDFVAGREGREETDDLYAAMHRQGIENFLIFPLEVTTKENLATRELWWIRKMGSNVYNIKGVLKHAHGQKWKALKRIGAGDILEGRVNIMREVIRVIKLRRLPIPTATLINILTKSRGVCTREEWNRVFDKVSDRVHRRLGVRIPRTLSIRISLR